MGLLEGGDGAGLDEVLVHSDQAADVAGRHVLDSLNLASHHQHCALKQQNIGLSVNSICYGQLVRLLDTHTPLIPIRAENKAGQQQYANLRIKNKIKTRSN